MNGKDWTNAARLFKAFHFKWYINPDHINPELDNYMRDISMDDKIQGEYGKHILREIAAKYLPHEIAWRLKKIGGPVYPVNVIKGWTDIDGEFGKTKWLNFQQAILDEHKRQP